MAVLSRPVKDGLPSHAIKRLAGCRRTQFVVRASARFCGAKAPTTSPRRLLRQAPSGPRSEAKCNGYRSCRASLASFRDGIMATNGQRAVPLYPISAPRATRTPSETHCEWAHKRVEKRSRGIIKCEIGALSLFPKKTDRWLFGTRKLDDPAGHGFAQPAGSGARHAPMLKNPLLCQRKRSDRVARLALPRGSAGR